MWITLLIVAGAAFGVGAGAGVLIYNWTVGGSGEASEPISAPTLDRNAVPTLSVEQLSTQNAQLAAENATLSAAVTQMAIAPTLDVAATPDPTDPAAAPTAAETNTDTQSATSQRVQYRIVQDESEARFIIMEDLFGERTTVTGRTDEVAADIVVDFGNPQLSQLGTVRINMRTLNTGNENRNRSLRARILQSAQDEFEFAQFAPTSITGLPDTPVAIGDTLTFQVTGDLTVRDVTRSVTFDAEVTVVSEDRLEGLATAMVTYPEFNLVIPSAPGVANVTEDVTLQIEFVALRVTE
jgi:polyisoprenoid-binding protein YceI